MNKALVVAKWEFLEKVKSKAFIISLVLMPIIIVVFGVLPGILASQEDDRMLTIGLIDGTGTLAGPLGERLAEKYVRDDGTSMYAVRTFGNGTVDPTGEALLALASEEVEGFFTIPSTVYDSGMVEYRAQNVGNIRVQDRVSRTIEELIVEQRLSARGFDPSEVRSLMTDVSVRSIKISEGGEESESGFLETFFSSYIVLMMLLFLIMTSGQLLIRSVVEEKQNRVIEVLLSSCSSQDLMTGKILGLSALGFVQMGVWLLGIVAITARAGEVSFQVDVLLYSFLYFALGYLLYAGIFVTAGSPVTTEQEAQQITSYVSLLLVFPIVLAIPAMQNPDATFIKVLSFIPVLTPAFMVLRMPIQMPAAWEIAGTLAVLAVSALIMMWVAGKVFRIAILVYGKRPSLGQLYTWIVRS